MDKLQAWLDRIRRAPRREVANLDHWELLMEARIAGAPIRWAANGRAAGDGGRGTGEARPRSGRRGLSGE